MPVPVNCFRVFDDLEGARCIDWIDANGAVTPTAVTDADGELETGWYNSAMQMIEHDRLKPDRGLPPEGKFLWDGVNLRLIKAARDEPEDDPLTNYGRGLKSAKDSRSIFMASLVDDLEEDVLVDISNSLLAYTSSDYVPINSELRVPTGRMPDDLSETIKHLDYLFAHASLTEDLVGTRLLTTNSSKRIRDHVGSQFKDTAFVSVHGSIDMDLVLGDDVEVVEIVVPQGSRALPVMHIAADKAQKEIIVARNSRWFVSEQDNVLRMTLVEQEPVGKAYNPNQPRDPGGEDGGQWVAAGQGVDDKKPKPEKKPKGSKLEITGDGASHAAIQKAFNSLPPEHQAMLEGVTFITRKSVNNPDTGRDVAGLMTFENGKYTVQVADTAMKNGQKLYMYNQQGTALHEMGHVLDFKTRHALAEGVKAQVMKDAAKASKKLQGFMAYYLSNRLEMAAELYHLRYAKAKSSYAFGTTVGKARQIFADSLALMDTIKLEIAKGMRVMLDKAEGVPGLPFFLFTREPGGALIVAWIDASGTPSYVDTTQTDMFDDMDVGYYDDELKLIQKLKPIEFEEDEA